MSSTAEYAIEYIACQLLDDAVDFFGNDLGKLVEFCSSDGAIEDAIAEYCTCNGMPDGIDGLTVETVRESAVSRLSNIDASTKLLVKQHVERLSRS